MNIPGGGEILFGRAVSSYQQGRLADAEAAARQVLDSDPGHADAYLLLGIIYYIWERLDDARASLENALRIRPGYAAAYNNLGLVFQKAGRLEDALATFERAIEHRQDYPEAHNNRGNVLRDLGRLEQALDAFNASVRLQPNNVQPHVNRGNTLTDLALIDQALQSYDKALELDPGNAEAYLGRGNALRIVGHISEAFDDFRKALELRPGYSDARNSLLYCSNYRPDFSAQQIFELHRRYGIGSDASGACKPAVGHAGSRVRRNRLRIGYLSPDFRHHSVACFFEPLLRAHHREKLEVYCYSNVKRPDDVTLRIQKTADHWLSVLNMSDEEVADRVSGDGIDILVDLAGYTSGNRLQVFTRRPAPVQVTWLGYPATTGMDCIDYRITDAVADPAGEADRLHSETLLRLEDGFLCYQPHEAAPEVARLPSDSAGHITFGSFNNVRKINPTVAYAWARILREIPGSRLLVKWRSLMADDVRARYLDLFSACGIEPDRIDLYDWSENSAAHLALYSRVDIALDTYPYNGTTTTCEALWMGVPVITLRGDRHASRVGASILERVGCAGWVAHTPEEYVDIARRLAGDLPALDGIRRGLRERLRESSLCDAEDFASRMEAAYAKIWEKYLAAT